MFEFDVQLYIVDYNIRCARDYTQNIKMKPTLIILSN